MVKARCGWCTEDRLYVRYHDTEWGVPTRDRTELFELLMLEGLQAGLSWITVLRKRAHLRKVFFEFAPERLARLTPKTVDARLADPGVIRHRGKIEGLARNARAFLRMESEISAATFFWSFVDGAPLENRWRSLGDVPPKTAQSEAMSKALKARGFVFVGPTICYAFMQAAGLVNDHVRGCYRYARVAKAKRCLVE